MGNELSLWATTKKVEGTFTLNHPVNLGENMKYAIFVKDLVAMFQERFISLDLTIDAKDQMGWDLQGTAHMMSFHDSFSSLSKSYFHWNYKNVNDNGLCWVRGHALDAKSHPCFTGHIRKNPQVTPDIYSQVPPNSQTL
ncbi:hypothetical protein Pcinc_009386 [Petrolisthes cinctipes]|uniref:Uncharacterized protein n=1 Tax=Petrolisthes cinctipes TaxID=88211 RepID=A0AAE1G7L1_PETCI|nr:hypothetical protein Pcinc_009383 [Petrolisthes cinctipes]KAK3886516.1 hypothetical protein Pcinc_009386 [Petrolisthes cinctipes]